MTHKYSSAHGTEFRKGPGGRLFSVTVISRNAIKGTVRRRDAIAMKWWGIVGETQPFAESVSGMKRSSTMLLWFMSLKPRSGQLVNTRVNVTFARNSGWWDSAGHAIARPNNYSWNDKIALFRRNSSRLEVKTSSYRLQLNRIKFLIILMYSSLASHEASIDL